MRPTAQDTCKRELRIPFAGLRLWSCYTPLRVVSKLYKHVTTAIQITQYTLSATVTNVVAIQQPLQVVVKALVDTNVCTSNHSVVAVAAARSLHGVTDATIIVGGTPSVTITSNRGALSNRGHH